MKSIFHVWQKDIVLIICLFAFSCFLINICRLFKHVESISEQTTEGFNNSTIEFKISSNDPIDFFFLDKTQSYAIVTRINEYSPIFRIIDSSNLFFLKNENAFFSYDIPNAKDMVYIRGEKANEICDLDPLIIGDKTFSEWDVIEDSDVIGIDYMIFISDISHIISPNTRFFLLGEEKSINVIYDQLVDHYGNDLKRLNNNYTSVQDIESFSESLFLDYFFVFLLVLCGFIMLIYWWTLKYKEIFAVGFLLGKNKRELLAIRDYLTVFTISYFLAYLFNHNVDFISALTTYAVVIGLSTFVLITIVVIKPGELNYEKDN